MTALKEIESALRSAAAKPGDAVVGLGRGWSTGSGMVIGPGRVLTSAHNIRREDVAVRFADGRQDPGALTGTDPDLDIAVIAVDTGTIEPVRWPEAQGAAEIGQAVMALSNPGGRGLRVTPGFVSAAARSFRGPRGRRIAGAIEHTAPLPRGSSGGPLVDVDGALLGINTVRVDGGLILAIPADPALRDRVERLGRGEAPTRLQLGVAIAPPRVARRLRAAVGLPPRAGVLIRAVEPESAAERAGLQRGDLIVAANQSEVERVDVLYEALDHAVAAEELELTILRGSDENRVTVKW